MTENYIYIGGSARGANPTEKETIAAHANWLVKILKARGYKYHIDKALLDPDINITNPKTKIPPEYYRGISKSMIDKISGLRDESETLETDIAMSRWTKATLESSVAAIWLHDRSQTGLALEVYKALFELKLYCLILYSTKSISSLLKGETSRLLITRRWWDDKRAENSVNDFLKKIESSRDRPRRILLSDTLDAFAERRTNELGLSSVSDYIRELISADRNGKNF